MPAAVRCGADDRQVPEQWWRCITRPLSLGGYSTVRNLRGSMVGGTLSVEVLFARTAFLPLYKAHSGWKRAPGTASRWLTHSTEPRVKLN